MALNIVEMSDVIHFIDSVSDNNIKQLLSRMRYEYIEYMKIGTPEECKRYKEWCNLRPTDYMKLIDISTQVLRDELECTEKYYKNKISELESKKKKS